jgi:hypothetical protein
VTLNYTTSVPVTKTVGEVQAILAAAGADRVSILYSDRQPIGVGFTLATAHGDREFQLPVNVDGVQTVLARDARTGKLKGHAPRGGWANYEQAARVAWRVAKDWLEAQLAIIEANMATLDQVMLPYLVIGDGRNGQTLYEAYRARESVALTAGTQG